MSQTESQFNRNLSDCQRNYDNMLPEDFEEEYVACSNCHKEFSADEIENDLCPDCLEGECI